MSELTREVSPAFVAFKALAAAALAQQPELLRLDCLNPVKAIAHDFDCSFPPEVTPERAWRQYLGLSFGHSFGTAGVRDALFKLFSGPLHERTVSLPADVYPVYQMIARKAGVRVETYPTLPTFQLANALRTDTVLLTAPLTPHGADLDPADVDVLLRWLRADANRLVVIDRVYDYANAPGLQPLLDTNQAIVCYSLSKTHLSPLVSGFVIAPERFVLPSLDPPETAPAAVLLTRYRHFPRTQRSVFRARWHALAGQIRAFDATWNPPETGYLSVVRANHAELLRRGVLAVPGAVYGTDDALSVISCLHETHAGAERELVDRYHVTALSNFARGYDKYGRTYSKANSPESTFPDRFFLLPADRLDIGFSKVRKLLQKTAPGDRPVVLHTQVERHELRPNERTGLGEFVERNHVRVEQLLDENLNALGIEDAYAESLERNGALLNWGHVRPRSLSVLPVARACQAKCDFCFSHSSVSDEQNQGRLMLTRLEAVCAASRKRGAERLVITGGGEPTLLAHHKLLEIMRVGAAHFIKVVLITNGYTLGHADPDERVRRLCDYHDNGLTVLALSRHSHDRNADIMHLETHSERVAHTWLAHRTRLVGLALRWVCVLQKGGVCDERTLRAYLGWVVETGGDEVCFKELYVAASRESVYRDTAYNEWSAAQQVPLSLVTEFLDANGAEKVSELPWGAPVYR
ncbi:MAG TPA: aminotransferase class I/II-fold pyridoxal phosphate-dependent enzyme, partial [Gemmata sp.]